MSEENVELAYRALDSFNRRDLDGFLAVQAENVRADPRLAAVEAATTATMESDAGGRVCSTEYLTSR
jgi:hypothetical protein